MGNRGRRTSTAVEPHRAAQTADRREPRTATSSDGRRRAAANGDERRKAGARGSNRRRIATEIRKVRNRATAPALRIAPEGVKPGSRSFGWGKRVYAAGGCPHSGRARHEQGAPQETGTFGPSTTAARRPQAAHRTERGHDITPVNATIAHQWSTENGATPHRPLQGTWLTHHPGRPTLHHRSNGPHRERYSDPSRPSQAPAGGDRGVESARGGLPERAGGIPVTPRHQVQSDGGPRSRAESRRAASPTGQDTDPRRHADDQAEARDAKDRRTRTVSDSNGGGR